MSAPGLAGARRNHGADAFAPVAARRTFHSLDALRGLAAAAVLLFHASFVYRVPLPPEGYLAVDLFFVMSGFIISHRYDRDFAAGMGVRAFLAVRLVRLYPLFLLGTLLGLLPSLATLALQERGSVHEATHWAMLSALPPALLMLPSRALLPDIQVLYPLDLVSWSLALEVLVNLAYAALFRRLTIPVLAAVAAAGVVGLCACAGVWGTLQVGFEWPHAAGGLARILFGFAAGVLIRRSSARGLALPPVPWPVPLIAALVLLCTPPLVGGLAWELAGCTIVVPLVVAAAVGSEPPCALHRACAAAGVASYVVYSLHVPLIGLLLRAQTLLHLDPARQGIGSALAFTTMLALACLAAHHLYDRPLRRLLSRALADGRAAGHGMSRGILSSTP